MGDGNARPGCSLVCRRAALLRHRKIHLARPAEVIEQVANLLLLQGVEQSLGHHGHLRLLDSGDLSTRNGDQFVGGLKADPVGVPRLYHSGEGSPVLVSTVVARYSFGMTALGNRMFWSR